MRVDSIVNAGSPARMAWVRYATLKVVRLELHCITTRDALWILQPSRLNYLGHSLLAIFCMTVSSTSFVATARLWLLATRGTALDFTPENTAPLVFLGTFVLVFGFFGFATMRWIGRTSKCPLTVDLLSDNILLDCRIIAKPSEVLFVYVDKLFGDSENSRYAVQLMMKSNTRTTVVQVSALFGFDEVRWIAHSLANHLSVKLEVFGE